MSITTTLLLPPQVTGRFVPFMLEACTSLRELKVQSVPQINWTHSSAWASGSLQRDLVMRKLHVRGANLNADFAALLAKMPGLTELEVDGPPDNVDAASTACSLLTRICYQVSDRLQLDDALAAFVSAKALSTLELVVKNFTLSTEQLRSIGMLPLTELRLDSFIYKQQPTLSRSSYSHVDNEGVKGLVDSVCSRWSTGGASSAGGGSASGILAAADMKPLKLSLCGATALTHDAVSALLRLPILTELDIGGCCRYAHIHTYATPCHAAVKSTAPLHADCSRPLASCCANRPTTN